MKGTVVCIHGAGGGGWEYDKWRTIFSAAGHQMIASDLVPSPDGLAATSFDDYLNQVKEWLPAHGPIILVGASMGGILALKVAEVCQVAALVLVNSVPPAAVGKSRAGRDYPPVVHWANSPIEDTRESLFDSDEPTVQWAYTQWRDESGRVMNDIGAGVEVLPPTVPTLAVLGEADTDIPYQTGLALAEWADADLFLYHGMSHVGPLLSQRAEEVARSVLLWREENADWG